MSYTRRLNLIFLKLVLLVNMIFFICIATTKPIDAIYLNNFLNDIMNQNIQMQYKKNVRLLYEENLQRDINNINNKLKDLELITNIFGDEAVEGTIVSTIIPNEILDIIYEVGFRVLVLDKKNASEYLYMDELIKEGIKFGFLPKGYKIDNDNPSDTVGMCAKYFNKIVTYDDSLTIIHEIGHAIDNISLDIKNKFIISETEYFKKIFEEEKNIGEYGDYSNVSTSEYFAEMFKYYFVLPDDLKKDRPRTYEYFDNLLEQIKIDKGLSIEFIDLLISKF